MPYLKYISDADFKFHTEQLITVAHEALATSSDKFHRNVIDPFAAIFEMSGFGISHSQWKTTEVQRQSQKTLQNHVGLFHQNVLGCVNDWENLKTGSQVDLVCRKQKIIAEIKNKHNTVTGSKLINVYEQLDALVSPKTNIYHGYTAYFVNILPKSPARSTKPFMPSDSKAGKRCRENPNILIIDGASFYEIVTGREAALAELYHALPSCINDILKTASPSSRMISTADIEKLDAYFKQACG